MSGEKKVFYTLEKIYQDNDNGAQTFTYLKDVPEEDSHYSEAMFECAKSLFKDNDYAKAKPFINKVVGNPNTSEELKGLAYPYLGVINSQLAKEENTISGASYSRIHSDHQSSEKIPVNPAQNTQKSSGSSPKT